MTREPAPGPAEATPALSQPPAPSRVLSEDSRKVLSREAILAAADIATEAVAVPEWGGVVLVRGLTGAERDNYEATLLVGKGKNRDVNIRNARAKLVARAVVDEAGQRLFSDADAAMLGDKSAAALERIFDVARRLSGLSDEDVEELAGNLPAGQNGASGSG